MPSIALTPQQRQILLHQRKRETKPSHRLRLHIVLLAADGHSPSTMARVLYCSRTTIYATVQRFSQEGEAAFAHQKPRGPAPSLERPVQQRLETLVEQEQPLHHGFLRSRWTCATLALQLLSERGIGVSRETVRRTLHRLGFRWRCPQPVPPPKNPEEKRQRLRRVLSVLRQLAAREGFFFQDETKLDLNPRVGFAWMRRGQQQPLPTPGTNRKLWVSGALNWVTGRFHWVVGPQRNSALFLSLVNELRRRCHRRLHLALDNDGSHTSGLVKECVAASQGRLWLHALPAWSPEDNPVEPIRWGLHEAITRNHHCRDLADLLGYACLYLDARQPFRLTLGKDYQALQRSPP